MGPQGEVDGDRGQDIRGYHHARYGSGRRIIRWMKAVPGGYVFTRFHKKKPFPSVPERAWEKKLDKFLTGKHLATETCVCRRAPPGTPVGSLYGGTGVSLVILYGGSRFHVYANFEKYPEKVKICQNIMGWRDVTAGKPGTAAGKSTLP